MGATSAKLHPSDSFQHREGSKNGISVVSPLIKDAVTDFCSEPSMANIYQDEMSTKVKNISPIKEGGSDGSDFSSSLPAEKIKSDLLIFTSEMPQSSAEECTNAPNLPPNNPNEDIEEVKNDDELFQANEQIKNHVQIFAAKELELTSVKPPLVHDLPLIVEDVTEFGEIVEVKEEPLVEKVPAPTRLMDFEIFRTCDGIPKYSDVKHLISHLVDIDRDNSLIVYISHSWLRRNNESFQWDGAPHPDNAQRDKFSHCVKGIQNIIDTMAVDMKKCYVWIDYMSTDYTNDLISSETLKQNIACADVIFTPVRHPATLPHPGLSDDDCVTSYVRFKERLDRDGRRAYLNRSWCRVEMLYAANIPVVPNTCLCVQRYSRFRGILRHCCKQKRRAHLYCGFDQFDADIQPYYMAPILPNKFEGKYNPLTGHLTNRADLETIRVLIEELKPLIRPSAAGYVGDRNEAGKKHGKGVQTFESFSEYEGTATYSEF